MQSTISANDNSKMSTRRRMSRQQSNWSFKTVKSRFSTQLSRISFSSKRSRRPSLFEIRVTVDQIKPHVFAAIEENPDLFHAKDIKRIDESDSFIQRFITEHQNPKKNNSEEILQLVIDSMKWRKEFGVNDLDPKIFCKEFFDLKVFVFGQIGPKEFMVYVKGRRFRKIDGLSDRIIQFAINCFESKVEEYGDDVRISAFADISGCGFAQVDLTLFMKAIPIFLRNYPAIAEHAYIYELPWILKPMAKLILACLPAKYGSMVTWCGKSDYLKTIPPEKLPDFLGGPVVTIAFEPVEGCMSLEECGADVGLTEDQINKTRKIVEGIMKEIKIEEAKGIK